jgi:hypothetical protein
MRSLAVPAFWTARSASHLGRVSARCGFNVSLYDSDERR